MHLRPEEFDAAIELLLKAEQDPRWPGTYLVHAPLALAHYHNGDIAQASAALDRSDAAIQELLSTFGEQPLQSTGPPWFDQIEGLQINREASQVIRGAPSSLTSQLDERRAAALNLINGHQP